MPVTWDEDVEKVQEAQTQPLSVPPSVGQPDSISPSGAGITSELDCRLGYNYTWTVSWATRPAGCNANGADLAYFNAHADGPSHPEATTRYMMMDRNTACSSQLKNTELARCERATEHFGCPRYPSIISGISENFCFWLLLRTHYCDEADLWPFLAVFKLINTATAFCPRGLQRLRSRVE